MTAERRAEISAATKARMASPEVRAHISQRTREGMARASGASDEMRLLWVAWNNARPSVRERFLSGLHAPICGKTAS
jgi:hypothetical protein